MTKLRQNKRPKSFYRKSANKRFKNNGRELDADMKGFLVTCNRNEFECKKDAYQLLNEYADKLYGPIESDTKEESDEEEDFELAVKNEVSDLKESKQWRFKALKSGANNVLFIKAEIENPCELAYYIFTDLQQTKKLKSRAVLRLLPISGTCKTHDDKVEKLAEEVVAPHFEFSCKTYMYVIKIRSNNSFKYKTVMGILDRIIQRNEDLNHHANMKDPELVILVEVIRNICCMSVVKDFKKFRKFNLHSIVEDANMTDEKNDVEDDSSGIDVKEPIEQSKNASKTTDIKLCEEESAKEVVNNAGTETVDKKSDTKSATEVVQDTGTETVDKKSDTKSATEVVKDTGTETVDKISDIESATEVVQDTGTETVDKKSDIESATEVV